MGRKEQIYDFIKEQNRALTGKEIVEALYPGKPQPYVNSCITQLVYEKKLVRDDSVKPYIIRLPFEGEEIVVKNYSRSETAFAPVVKIKKSVVRQRARTIKEKRADILRPSEADVEKYLSTWEKLENYTMQEKALDKLFFHTYPKNTSIEEILVKVATLNDFYSTNIFAGYLVAKHILSLNIDERLNAADETLVNEIATIVMDEGKEKNFYSFATKYCSHHKPYDYAIYDSYVDKVLRYFRNVDGFSQFEDSDLKDYVKFRKVLSDFQGFYGLEKYNLKLLDRYLWQLGKDKFPKNYYR